MAALSRTSGVRPIRWPSSRARRMPARTLSTIRLRSNSAMAPMITMMARPSGIDVFPEADELHFQATQIVQHFEEVPGRACDTIAGPDQKHVEPAAACIDHHLIESRPLGFRATDLVAVLLDDLV